MLFRETIELVSTTKTTNKYGDTIESETLTTVYADKKSVRQSEFYQAHATGLRPELMFVIRLIDYNNQPRIKYNNKYYNIIRNYSKNGELIELLCEGIVGSEIKQSTVVYIPYIPIGSDNYITSDGKIYNVRGE